MLKNMEVNKDVINANIHELFVFFNLAFFDCKLEAVILEWSIKMTSCAGICYYDVIISWLTCLERTLYHSIEQIITSVSVWERTLRNSYPWNDTCLLVFDKERVWSWWYWWTWKGNDSFSFICWNLGFLSKNEGDQYHHRIRYFCVSYLPWRSREVSGTRLAL